MPHKETIEHIRADRNYHRRAHMALAGGIAKMQWAAEVAGRMNWGEKRPEDVILCVRSYVLGDEGYGPDLPLCEIEQDMAARKLNSFAVLLAYEVVAPTIRKQLSAAARLSRASALANKSKAPSPRRASDRV